LLIKLIKSTSARLIFLKKAVCPMNNIDSKTTTH
jgi:hypothetical protein